MSYPGLKHEGETFSEGRSNAENAENDHCQAQKFHETDPTVVVTYHHE